MYLSRPDALGSSHLAGLNVLASGPQIEGSLFRRYADVWTMVWRNMMNGYLVGNCNFGVTYTWQEEGIIQLIAFGGYDAG